MSAFDDEVKRIKNNDSIYIEQLAQRLSHLEKVVSKLKEVRDYENKIL